MNTVQKYRIYIVAAFIFSTAITISIMMPFCYQSNIQEENSINTNVLSDSTWFLTKNRSMSLIVEGTKIPDITLNSDSGEIKLYNLINKPTLIFRFFESNCNTCIQTEAELIQKYTKDIADQVILIGSFNNYRALKAYNVANEINLTGLQIGSGEQLGWEIDTHNSPYYFVLYPGGKTSQFFMSVPEFSSYSQTYLEGINRLFSNKE